MIKKTGHYRIPDIELDLFNPTLIPMLNLGVKGDGIGSEQKTISVNVRVEVEGATKMLLMTGIPVETFAFDENNAQDMEVLMNRISNKFDTDFKL